MTKNVLTPVKAIRAKCLECGGRPKEVRICETQTCSLYIYRLGKNPNRSGIGGKKPYPDKETATQVGISDR